MRQHHAAASRLPTNLPLSDSPLAGEPCIRLTDNRYEHMLPLAAASRMKGIRQTADCSSRSSAAEQYRTEAQPTSNPVGHCSREKPLNGEGCAQRAAQNGQSGLVSKSSGRADFSVKGATKDCQKRQHRAEFAAGVKRRKTQLLNASTLLSVAGSGRLRGSAVSTPAAAVSTQKQLGTAMRVQQEAGSTENVARLCSAPLLGYSKKSECAVKGSSGGTGMLIPMDIFD